MRHHANAVLAVVTCPSVHLSITHWHCIKTAKHRITQAMPHDSDAILVFWRQRSWHSSNRITPNGGTKCRWGRL